MLTPETEPVQVLSVCIVTEDPSEIVTGKLYAFQLLPQTLPFFCVKMNFCFFNIIK